MQLVRSHRYELHSDDGDTVYTTSSGQPTLDRLREWSREYEGPLSRLDLWDAPLFCTECRQAIGDRFGADNDGNLLCWSCADAGREDGICLTDPTKAVVGESALHKKGLCDWNINCATGCAYGCRFCYVPSTPNIWGRSQMLEDVADVDRDDHREEWGEYLLYRDDAPERLAHVGSCRKPTGWDDDDGWHRTDPGGGVTGLSFHTDAYQDRRAAQISREIVVEMVNHGRPVRILSRSPAIVRDLDVFEAADGLVTVGSSIPTLDETQNAALEPDSPPPGARLDALKTLSEAGVPVFVSMSPTYPTQSKEDLRDLMEAFSSLDTLEVIFSEPINPRGDNFEALVDGANAADAEALADALEDVRPKQRWVEYAMDHLTWVQDIGAELGLPVHVWPDATLVDDAPSAHEREWVAAWRGRCTPETIGTGEKRSSEAVPTLPPRSTTVDVLDYG